jgi:hypothetical protein
MVVFCRPIRAPQSVYLMKSNTSLSRFLHSSLDAAAFVFLYLVLVLPSNLDWITPLALVYFPLEALLLCLLLLPGGAGTSIRRLAAVVLAAGLVFKVADMAAYKVFARQFNPVFDAYLLADGMNLLNGAIGRVGALLVALLLVALVVGIAVLAFTALARVQQVLRQHTQRSILVLFGFALLFVVLGLIGVRRTSTLFHDQLVMHASNTLASIADIKDFRTIVDDDLHATTPGDTLFTALQGKDVLVVINESYGRTVLDNPVFSAQVKPALEQGNAALAAAGLAARSAFLTSPTVGGISWLAHGTALSGLWIDSQVRYDSLMMSERLTLNRLFQRAGWRTVAVMPAITMVWPEGNYFGYDAIYAADNLGYRGLPFNWVTMPDQYVLSAFQARERQDGPRAPVMAELALVSSHAPWTPTPQLVPWPSVGDGSIFSAQAEAGPTPEEVWQETARIQQQYRKSIEYVMANLVSYAVTYGDDSLVLLILGDHQPAPLVSGATDNRDVPVHLIARDPAVLEAIAHWQWSNGLLPEDNAPVWRMDELRDRFVAAFSALAAGIH